MTPGELSLAVEARNEREEAREKAEWYRLAWFTSYLLQPYIKRGRTIDPETLLPKSMRRKMKPRTKDEVRRELEEIKRNVGMKDEE